MSRRHDFVVDDVGKNMSCAVRRQIAVQPLHFRQAAAKHDDLWIEDVDDARQGTSQAGFVALQRGLAGAVAGVGQLIDPVGGELLAGMPEVVVGQRRPGQIGFDTALAAAIAGGRRQIDGGRAGQGIVTPFAGNRTGTGQDPSIDHDAATDTGTENDAENDLGALSATVGGFGQGEAIGVVSQPDFPAQPLLQVAAQGAADQAGRVGVLDQAAGLRFGTRNRDPDAALPAQFGFGLLDQAADRLDGGAVVALRRGDATTQAFAAIIGQRDDFDLGAAEVDAQPHQTRTAMPLTLP